MSESKIYKGAILPAERELRMPDGTPLGLGILGAARFSAIRRVLDYAARAANAKANFHTAEGAVLSSLVSRERARRQLENIEAICDDDEARFNEGAEIASLRRRLEKMELEDQISERDARRAKVRAASAGPAVPQGGGVSQDEFAAFLNDIKKLPEMAKAVTEAKAAIVKNSGGKDTLSEFEQQVCEMLDSMLFGFMSKKAGDAAL